MTTILMKEVFCEQCGVVYVCKSGVRAHEVADEHRKKHIPKIEVRTHYTR